MAMPNIPALQYLLEAELEGGYEPRITKPSTGAASSLVISQNFERLAFSISNFGAYDVTLSPDGPSVGGSGFILGAGGGFLSVNWRQDVLLPGLPWYASSATGTSNLLIIELVRYRGAKK